MADGTQDRRTSGPGRGGPRDGIDARVQRRQRLRNRLPALALLAGMVVVFAVVAWVLLGPSGLVTILVVGVTLTLFRPRVPTSWVLRMYRATPLPERYAPQLHRTLDTLSERAGLRRTPQLYYVPSAVPNAFATGHGDDTAVAVTDGILRTLSGRELVGVLAHEISHIRAGDTRVMNLSDVIARMTHGLSYLGMGLVLLTLPLTFAGDYRPLLMGLALTVLPVVTTLLQSGLSRSREYDADIQGAALTGDPEGLARGLEALERAAGGIWERLMVPRGRAPDPTLLSSHPPTEERVRRLRALRPESLGPDRSPAPGNDIGPPTGYPPVHGPATVAEPGDQVVTTVPRVAASGRTRGFPVYPQVRSLRTSR